MKYNHGVLSQEGFDSGYVIVFENGLVLKTKSVLWAGRDGKEEVRKQLDEVLQILEKSPGFELSQDVQEP
jgi:hypothetical protein